MAALMVVTTTPAAHASSNAAWARRCQVEYASLGYRNVGQCVSHFARGGGVVTGPASLTLTFEAAECALWPGSDCVWSVRGSGLDPGSTVVVGGVDVLYGGEVTVASDGTVDVRGIFLLGECVLAGSEIQRFVARGIAAGGSPVSSDVVTGDLTAYMPVCDWAA